MARFVETGECVSCLTATLPLNFCLILFGVLQFITLWRLFSLITSLCAVNHSSFLSSFAVISLDLDPNLPFSSFSSFSSVIYPIRVPLFTLHRLRPLIVNTYLLSNVFYGPTALVILSLGLFSQLYLFAWAILKIAHFAATEGFKLKKLSVTALLLCFLAFLCMVPLCPSPL